MRLTAFPRALSPRSAKGMGEGSDHFDGPPAPRMITVSSPSLSRRGGKGTVVVLLALGIVLSACGGGAAPASSPAASVASSSAAAANPAASGAASAKPAASGAASASAKPVASSSAAASAKPSASGAASGAKPAASAGAAIPLKIGYATGSAGFWPIYVAKEGGYFTKYGIDATLTLLAGNLLVPAMLSHQIDVVDLAAGGFVPADLGGADFKMITSDTNATTYGFAVNKDIQNVQDLKGKTVSISGPGQSDDFVMRRVLNMNNLTPQKDVSFINSGGTPQTMAVLLANQAVGGMMSPPTVFKALDQGLHLLLRPADLFEYQGSGLLLSAAYMATPQGGDVALKLAHSMYDASMRIHNDKAFAEQALMKYVDGTTQDLADKTYDWTVPHMPADATPSLTGLQAVIDDLKPTFQGKTPPTADSLLELKYLNQVKAEASASPKS
jgi:ABC-type nitrate/sulfonate/bicarbonate transport system substrate-binding protein